MTMAPWAERRAVHGARTALAMGGLIQGSIVRKLLAGYDRIHKQLVESDKELKDWKGVAKMNAQRVAELESALVAAGIDVT